MFLLAKIALSLMLIMPNVPVVDIEVNAAPDTHVVVHDSGNIELVSDDTTWMEVLQLNETKYQLTNEVNTFDFTGDMIEKIDDKIFIPNNFVYDNKINGEYNLRINNPNYEVLNLQVTINLNIEKQLDFDDGGLLVNQDVSELSINVNIDVIQLENGDLKVSCDNQNYLESITSINLDTENGRYDYFNGWRTEIFVYDGYVLVPYNILIDRGLIIRTYDVSVDAEGFTSNSVKNFVLHKGLIEAPNVTITQADNGSIIIKSDNNEYYQYVKSIYFTKVDDENVSNSFASYEFDTKNDCIEISLENVNAAGLIKGDYKVYIHSDVYQLKVLDDIQLTMGAIVAPSASIEQLENGDLKITSDDQSYLDSIDCISLSNFDANIHEQICNQNGEVKVNKGFAVVDFNHLLKQGITPNLYEVTIESNGYAKLKLDNLKITQGAEVAPKVKVEQLANGDLKISSDNQSYLNSINWIALMNFRDNMYGQFWNYNGEVRVNQGFALIEFNDLLNKGIAPNVYKLEILSNGYSSIELDNIRITKGAEAAPVFNVEQLANGDVKVSCDNQDYLESITSINFDTKYGRSGYSNEWRTEIYLYEGYTLIPYEILIDKGLKVGTYDVSVNAGGFTTNVVKSFVLHKGLIEAPNVNVTQAENGNVIIKSDKNEYYEFVEYVHFMNIDDSNVAYSFGSDIFYVSNDTIVIPFKNIVDAGLSKGNYKILIGSNIYELKICENIKLSMGAKLAPSVSIEQSSNGDLKIKSDDQTYLESIDWIFINNSDADILGRISSQNGELKVSEGFAVVEFDHLLKEGITPNLYEIVIASDGYSAKGFENFNITKGAVAAPQFSVEQLTNGDLRISSNNQSYLDNINWITLKNFRDDMYGQFWKQNGEVKVSQGFALVNFDQLLKDGIAPNTYELEIVSHGYSRNKLDDFKITKGAIDAPKFNVEQLTNGDLKISSSNQEFINQLHWITLTPRDENMEYIFLENGADWFPIEVFQGYAIVKYDVLSELEIEVGKYDVKVLSIGYRETEAIELITQKGVEIITDVKFEQLANGDIKISSTNQVFLANINYFVITNDELSAHVESEDIKVSQGYVTIDKSVFKSLVNTSGYATLYVWSTGFKSVTKDGFKYSFKNQYEGHINSELLSFSLKSNAVGDYLTGQVVVVEWIDGVSTVPQTTPSFELKSTDGEITKPLFMTPEGTNTYYFDGFINGLDMTKEYKVEIASTNPNNISQNKQMYLRTDTSPNVANTDVLGVADDHEVHYVTDNGELKVKFKSNDPSYIGNINSELLTFTLEKNEIGDYLTGQVVVVEWVNGVSTVPETVPTFELKSTDGEITKPLFMTPTGTNTYYFDGFINGLDMSKEYKVEIASTNPNNIGTNKHMFLRTDTSPNVGDKGNLGIADNHGVHYVSDAGELKVIFKAFNLSYEGDINSELLSFSLEKNTNGDYLTGQVVVVEWINGLSTVPKETPTFSLKSTDGSVTKQLFMTPTGTNTYYFDGFINGLDMSKEYRVEITSGSIHNMSENKSMYLRTDTAPNIDAEKLLGILEGKNVQYYTNNGELIVNFSK